MKDSEAPSEPKDSVTLLRAYAAIRVFHADTFARARTLMRNCAQEIEDLRTQVKDLTKGNAKEDWDQAQSALRAALAYVESRTPPLSTAGTDIDLQKVIKAAIRLPNADSAGASTDG